MNSTFPSHWKAHGQELVNTMAADSGPDVIGLLHDKTGYGVYGDHGGAQQSVQRVPMVFWTPDAMPTILAAMGISRTYRADGRPHRLER